MLVHKNYQTAQKATKNNTLLSFRLVHIVHMTDQL